MNLNDLLGCADEPELNEFQLAWYAHDWKKVDQLVERFDEVKPNAFFELLDNINLNKDPEADTSAFSSWQICKTYAQQNDTLHAAYMLNAMPNLPVKFQYIYMMESVSKGKRYIKSAKVKSPVEDQLINGLVSDGLGVSLDRAAATARFLAQKGVLDTFIKENLFRVTEAFCERYARNKTDAKAMLKEADKRKKGK